MVFFTRNCYNPVQAYRAISGLGPHHLVIISSGFLMPISPSVFIKPWAQCTKHFVVLIDVPALPKGSSLLHTGGHPSSGTFLPHSGGNWSGQTRNETGGNRPKHPTPAACLVLPGQGSAPGLLSTSHFTLLPPGGLFHLCQSTTYIS